MSLNKGFYLKKEDLTADKRSSCTKKCKNIDDDMLTCCNSSLPCTKLTHLQCIPLDRAIILMLENFYCEICLQIDTRGLKSAWEEEVKKAEASVKAMKEALKVDETEKENSSLKLKVSSLEKTVQDVLAELKQSTDFNHTRNEEVKEFAITIETLKSEVAALKLEQEHFKTCNETLNINSVLEQSRLERGGAAHESTSAQVSFSIPQSSSMSQNSSTHSRTLSQMYSIYPQYDYQEVQANKMLPESLRIIRENIAKVPEFTGDSSDWATFKTLFVATSERGHFRRVEDMERLRTLIQGEARRMYNPEISSPFADPIAILKKLDEFYGLKGNPVRHHLDTINKLPKITNENDREKTVQLFTAVKQYYLLCEQHDQESELKAESSLYIIESKMLHSHVPYWRRWCEKKHLIVNVVNLALFLEDQIKRIEERQSPSRGSSHVLYSFPSETSLPSTSSQQSSAAAFAQRKKKKNKTKNRKPCLICNGEHPVYQCPQIIKGSQQQRRELVKRHKICENCLASNNHNLDGCKRKNRPIKCPLDSCNIKYQHPLLHGHANELMGSLVNINFHHVLTVESKMSSTFYKIIPGHAVGQNGELISTTVLLDQGAGLSLAEKDFLKRGGWSSKAHEVSMRWTKNIIRTEPNAAKFDLEFIPLGSKYKFKLQDIIAVDNLDLPLQNQHAEEIKSEFPYLKNVPLPSYESQKPQILLGLPHNKLIASYHVVKGEKSGPTAELCELGWTVGGTSGRNWDIEELTEPLLVGFVCSDTRNSESMDPLMDLIKYHYSFESLGIKSTKGGSSLDDLQAQKFLNETIRFIPELKRYVARLLWINPQCDMPYNYELTYCRLVLSEKRLIKLGLDKVINEQFEKEIASGQLVKVTKEELAAHKRVNFIPGFVTFNPNKIIQKPRWVHDPTPNFKGISLNKMLLKGPDNLVALPKAICAFREEAIAYTADVKSMFNQILMDDEDQYSQLSLWRFCDTSREPEIYKQTRLIFGPKCSPSIANAVRIIHAKKSALKYPEAAEVALNQMYMDDALDSRSSVPIAVKVALDLIRMFLECSWEMMQFQSNSAEFLSQLPPERVSDKMVELCSGESEENFTKVLGIFWKPATDKIIMKLNDEKLLQKCFEGYIPTRKEVLSLIMRLYDPMGFISHFIIHGRLLLQELCRRALSWKDKIPEDLIPKWKQWMEEFQQIQKLEIPRQYIPRSADNCIISYHLFVDASIEGYSAVIFIRYEFIDAIYVRLLTSKSRVAPLSYNSVPRLELVAALMGSRLLHSALAWRRKHSPSSYTCWSDSTPVLKYIYAKHIRHTQFVAPRIAEIHEKTNIQAWRYVGTKENIADLGTKWLQLDYSDPNHPWFVGPEFLYKTPEHWPKPPEGLNLPCVSESQVPIVEENPREYVLLTEPMGVINPRQAGSILSVSSKIRADWSIYPRVVAKALRVFYKRFRRPVGSNVMCQEELIIAEQFLIRKVQIESFPEDYERLSNGKNIDPGSKIKSLSPFFCEETKLIRVRTRLSTNFPYDTRCPPLLPNNHELTDSIVSFYHNKHGHAGDNKILGEIRSKVWIISGRRAVRRQRARCTYCIHKRAKPQIPPMAPLPEFRQDNDKLPFYYTAVDCYGPFETYCGKSYFKKKVSCIIFVCLITRAVYLDVLDDMTEDSVLAAIEKLNARRGPVQHIYSDNGTNFVGANNILQKREFNKDLGVKIINIRNIEWHFQPPQAPNFGGVHERMIKEVKRALHASVGKFPVRRIALEIALAIIESDMNDRPLTDLEVTPDDLEPITPNLLIKGHNNQPFYVAEKVLQKDIVSKNYIKQSQALVMAYRKRWFQEVLPTIARHPKNKKPGYFLKENDYVIYCNPKEPPRKWLKGIIAETYRGSDGITRVADVKMIDGSMEFRRPAIRLAKIDIRLEREAAENGAGNLTANENLQSQAAASSAVTRNVKSQVLFIDSKQNKSIQNSINSITMSESRHTKPRSSFILKAGDMPNLSDDQIKGFFDVEMRKTLFVGNLPAKLGIVELYSIVDVIGRVKSMYVRKWNGHDSFNAFITFEEQISPEQVKKFNGSLVIGIVSLMTYNRLKVERPVNFKPRFPNANVNWVFIGHKNRYIRVVRPNSSSTEAMPIPLLSNEDYIMRECEPTHKYDFQVVTLSKDVHTRKEMYDMDLLMVPKNPKMNSPTSQQKSSETHHNRKRPIEQMRKDEVEDSEFDIELHPNASDLAAFDEEEPRVKRQIVHKPEEVHKLKSVIIKVRK